MRLGLLSAFLVLSSTAAHLCGAELVLDRDGDPVQPYTDYYVIYKGPNPPDIANYDLIRTKLNGTSYVGIFGRDFDDPSLNVPVRIHPIIPGPVINVFDHVNLAFSGRGSLGGGEESGFWTMAPTSNGNELLATAGEGSRFMIVKSEDGLAPLTYKLCTVENCRPLDIVLEDGLRFLGVREPSEFSLVFSKAEPYRSSDHLRKYSSESE